ncbi:MAG: membrane protein insertion efficiency factor YidD [Phycisphaerae bacterium]|jgi:hypothetical protein|nr:membrane protein insertion efficiency factor YidD [Phycisphaerae bacterium]
MSGDASLGRRLAHQFSVQVVRVLVLFVRLYQVSLSPWVGRQCRFEPTCSEYMIDALRKRGPILGLGQGMWRILRCHPFSRGGRDPA